MVRNQIMKTQFKIAASIFGGLMLTLASSAIYAQTVTGSLHDLGSGGTAQATTGLTGEVCVFCHTPHGADISAAVPLWNKVLGTPSSYTMYSTLQTPTFESTEAPVGSVSLACLSCHDGVQAMDVVINMPGSGGWNAAGAEIDGTAIGIMTGSPVPMLGTDLRDDHPISMQYAAGGCTSTDTDDALCTATLGDPDFNAPMKTTVNTNPIWWVDSVVGTDLVREKTDMILYTRNDAILGGGAIEPFVECGSCHDPHNDGTASATSVAFLRIDNTASQICTTCHIK